LSPIPFDVAMIRGVKGHGLLKAGDVRAATAELEEAAAWFEQSRLRYTKAAVTIRLAEAYLAACETARARAVAEEALATSRDGGARYIEGVAERVLGQALAQDDCEAATKHLETSREILDAIGARDEMARTLVAQAGVRRAGGDTAGARRLLETALTVFEALGTRDEPRRVRAELAELE
jgi:tetratricopeptide (TPR) repeat protein